MTTQEKLTKIESVIRECCPELPRYPLYITNSATILADVMERINAGEVVMIPTPYTSNDIKLEHILRAGNFCISSSGKIFDGDINVPTGHTYTFMPDDAVIYYDLTKPYHLQSDEFISWLYGVLVGE